MSTTHALVLERAETPSRSAVRKIIGQSHVAAGFRMKEGYLYTVVRAISARVNQNYDGWPSYELKAAAHTFVGKPCFVNHENFDPDKARGVVVAARYREVGQDKFIETVMEIDAKRFPLLAAEIKTGGLDSVSMGAEAGFTICSACGNKAYDEPDMCDHVKYHKGEKLQVRNRKTGRVEEKLVYESCHKLSFFELSYVFDPADETAVASKVIMGTIEHDKPKDAKNTVSPEQKKPTTINDKQLRKVHDGDKSVGSEVETNSGDGSDAEGKNRKTAGGDCPPGDPSCTGINRTMEPSGNADIGLQGHGGVGNNGGGAGAPANGLGATPGAAGGVDNSNLGKTPSQGGTPQAGDAKVMPQTKPLYDQLMKENPGADIGTYRVDDYHEHDHGAMDFMTKDPAQAEKVRSEAFGAGAPYVLWQQTQWNADGTSSKMENRGDPTQNHMDHVHIAPIPGQAKAKAAVRNAILARLRTASPTDDYFEWAKKVDSGEIEPERETGPATGGGPSRAQQQWLKNQKSRTAMPVLAPGENSGSTQIPGTAPTYAKAHAWFDGERAPRGKVLDYGAGLGHSSQYGDTFEPNPNPRSKFGPPTYDDASQVPEGGYHRVTNLNVLNVVPPEIRDQIVDGIGRSMAPGGHAIITTRGADVMKGQPHPDYDQPDEPGAIITGNPARYQKGFGRKELHQYVSERLGPGYAVKPIPLGPAGVHIVRHAGTTANLKEALAVAIYRKLAWGETEAPPAVDTLREEGSAPEDDNDDFHHYVESPDELSSPDLSQATQLDREQEEGGQGGPGDTPGTPPAAGDPATGTDTDDPTQYMVLKIPIPGSGPAAAAPAAGPPASAIPQGPAAPMPMPPGGGMAPAGAPPAAPPTGAAPQTDPTQQPQVPMQAFGSKVGALQTLAYFERYYGYRVANWRDAIEAGRDLNPEEYADYVREASVETLENRGADSPRSRNPVKGTANMARSTLATRRKTAATSHFAEGPLTDGGDVSRNDEGEQEEAFITSVPSPEPASTPKDGEEISNTEGNLVADEAYAHSLTAKLAQQRRELEATAREYARIAGVRTADEHPGGEYATEVNPTVQNSASEQLTGDHFDSPALDEVDTSPGGPGTTSLPIESSLQAFRAFDKWLTASTGKNSRQHSEANIKKAAKQFANYNGIQVQGMFPALGIALRQARKTEAAKKGSTMRKRAVDLETAAPDDRVSVPAPVADTTDAEAQASQFHEDGYANNAGDNLADPDQSTGQNFAPGQAPGKSAKKADGILAIRCAEAMIAAGLEPNTRERKYQLAAEFSKMSRGLILDRVALAERFAMVRHADRQKVASGSTRGAARSPIPAGLTQGGNTRTASQQRIAENSPDNDALLFG